MSSLSIVVNLTAVALLVLALRAHRTPSKALASGAKLLAASAVAAVLLGAGTEIAGWLCWVSALVSVVAGAALRFASRHMHGDRHAGPFARALIALAAANLVIVVAGTTMLFALAWVASSLLVLHLCGLYAPRGRTSRPGGDRLRTLLVGDVCLVAAVVVLLGAGHGADFDRLAAGSAPTVEVFAAGLLVLSVLIRCAAAPWHGWLFATLNAPTALSALLHAGFVNAGAIACFKFAPLLLAHPWILLLTAAAGALAVGLGAVAAMLRVDVKGQLAASTVNQLGFMLMQLGMGAFGHALLHLLAHAAYKALAFLHSGGAPGRREDRPHGRSANAWSMLVAPGSFLVLNALTDLSTADLILVCCFIAMLLEGGAQAAASGWVARLAATAVPLAGAAVAFALPLGLTAPVATDLPMWVERLAGHVGLLLLAFLSVANFARDARLQLPSRVYARAMSLAFPEPAPRRVRRVRPLRAKPSLARDFT